MIDENHEHPQETTSQLPQLQPVQTEQSLFDATDPVQLHLLRELEDHRIRALTPVRIGGTALAKIVGDTYEASGIAARWALRSARNAPRSALTILKTVVQWPDTQVSRDDFYKTALDAAAVGDAQTALESVSMSIPPIEIPEETQYLDHANIVYNRAHRALYAIQTLGIVYSAFLNHKTKEKIIEVSEAEQKIIDALNKAVAEFADQAKLGPIQQIYELSSRGIGEISVLGNYVVKIVESLKDENRAETVRSSLAKRIPMPKHSKKK